KKWLTVFCRRFFANQFKRSALPNAPKVLAGGSLSPRGDWRMPADATARARLTEIETEGPGDRAPGPGAGRGPAGARCAAAPRPGVAPRRRADRARRR